MSFYLDVVRLSAALIVMASHLGEKGWTGGLGWQFIPFGGPAVDVFFVLSGYVIAFVAAERERDLTTFAISRLARIYSVALPVLGLTILLCSFGQMVRPDMRWGDDTALAYLVSAAFLNQVWFWSVQPGTNGPYWSLGYEVWYYIAFSCAVFGTGWWRYILPAACMLVAGPRIASMLPLWLFGVAAYHIVRRLRRAGMLAVIAWVTTAAALGAAVVWRLWDVQSCGGDCTLTGAYLRRAGESMQYAVDYAIGLLVAANFASLALMSSRWTIPGERSVSVVQWLSGATFTIYLLHYPVGRVLLALSPWPVGSLVHGVFVYVGTLVTVFAVAMVTERKKHVWRSMVTAALAPRRPGPA